jgi:hypothetical protein
MRCLAVHVGICLYDESADGIVFTNLLNLDTAILRRIIVLKLFPVFGLGSKTPGLEVGFRIVLDPGFGNVPDI